MTDSNKQFPSQQQEGQHGSEHEMHPSPEIVRSTYKSSDKLMVYFLFLYLIHLKNGNAWLYYL